VAAAAPSSKPEMTSFEAVERMLDSFDAFYEQLKGELTKDVAADIKCSGTSTKNRKSLLDSFFSRLDSETTVITSS
jgi:hypothetical protein